MKKLMLCLTLIVALFAAAPAAAVEEDGGSGGSGQRCMWHGDPYNAWHYQVWIDGYGWFWTTNPC